MFPVPLASFDAREICSEISHAGINWFMTLLDLEDYIATKDKMFADYKDEEKWKRMMLVNIAKAGFFSIALLFL